MYYQELLEIINKTGAKESIEKLDRYLAFLPNRSENIITPSNIASKLELDINIVDVIFDFMYDINLIDRVYIVVCPNCGREILIVEKNTLIDKIKKLDFCNKCKCDIEDINEEDIYVGYKIIKQPVLDEEEIRRETERLLYSHKTTIPIDNLKVLKELFENSKEKPHDFFYNPSKAEMNSIKSQFKKLDDDYGDSTTAKGKALEGLVCRLLNLCKGLKATTKIHTPTNQIDCTVRNDFCIPLTVYRELGSIVKVECKNEPNKKPGNGYYHKLNGIIQLSKNPTEQSVGILVSRKKISCTCNRLAREYFLRDKIIIINIYDDDLNRVINQGANLLDVIQEKIQYVKNDIVTKPNEHNLYR